MSSFESAADSRKKRAIQEEKESFYNVASANADYVHWSKAAYWSLDEAVALSFGKDPSQVNKAKLNLLKIKTAFVEDYLKLLDLVMRFQNTDNILTKIKPLVFIDWAMTMESHLPNELLNEVEKRIDWKEEHQKQREAELVKENQLEKYKTLKIEHEDLKVSNEKLLNQPHINKNNKQKKESTRKTENVLQAFTAIAIDAYGYDPKAEKSTAPKDIADALTKLGKKVDPRTIRTWLKEGAELLPSEAHKH